MRGLAASAKALAGDDPEAVCATLRRWAEHHQRELPWLAGPGLSALRRAGVSAPSGSDLRTVQRFLVGAEADADAVLLAIDRCAAGAGDPGPPMPPDATGALADAVDRFFDLLTAAYAQLHVPVRTGHRRNADELVAQWQTRLDEAADEVDERARVATGEYAAAMTARTKPAWGTKDRPGCALAFVVVALLIAAVLVSAVMNGWPAAPFQLGI